MSKISFAYALKKLYPTASYSLLTQSYEDLEWTDTIIPKPTKQEILDKQTSLLNEEPMILLREERNKKLNECDWTQTTDSPLTDDKKSEWATYRQLLRDLPGISTPTLDQYGHLDETSFEWPTKPQ